MTPETPPETPSCPPSPRNAQLRAHSSPLPHLPHIDELELGLEPLEANIPPSLSRSTSSESEHRPLTPSLYRLPSPAPSDESYCSDCPDCAERKRKRSSDELDDDEEDGAGVEVELGPPTETGKPPTVAPPTKRKGKGKAAPGEDLVIGDGRISPFMVKAFVR